jgi:VIT1/CCC1 family predicted Fe2+/Mn2+ transporter
MSSIKTKLDESAQYLIKKLPNQNWFIQTINVLFVIIASFIPIYVYVFFRWLFDPVTFWQQLTLFIVWAVLLGWAQIAALIIAIVIIILLFETR